MIWRCCIGAIVREPLNRVRALEHRLAEPGPQRPVPQHANVGARQRPRRHDVGRHHLSVVTVEGERQGDNLAARAGEQEDVGALALIRASCRIRPRRGLRWRRWTRGRQQQAVHLHDVANPLPIAAGPEGPVRHCPDRRWPYAARLSSPPESASVDQGGQAATNWTRLSCHRFQVRLLLDVIAHNFGQSLALAGLAPCPELVADEPPAGPLQDWRPPHPACPILHPPAGRKPLDLDSPSADSRAHRATRVTSHVIKRTARAKNSLVDASGGGLRGGEAGVTSS